MPQSLVKIYIHAIFSTKNRELLLAESWRDELFKILATTANNLGCPSIAVGGVEDHVHMLFLLCRTLSPADSISKIKSTSSLWINQTRGLVAPFHWQRGYAMFSASQSNANDVKAYILRQAEHHKRQSFQEELREWLQRYEMEWDECFVWD